MFPVTCEKTLVSYSFTTLQGVLRFGIKFVDDNRREKIIRDLTCISDRIEIKSVSNELIFRCKGTFAQAEVRRAESDGSTEFIQQDAQKIIQGEFSLKKE